jgi:hypothetical protein
LLNFPKFQKSSLIYGLLGRTNLTSCKLSRRLNVSKNENALQVGATKTTNPRRKDSSFSKNPRLHLGEVRKLNPKHIDSDYWYDPHE